MKVRSLAAAALSALFLGVFVGAWHLATLPKAESQGGPPVVS